MLAQVIGFLSSQTLYIRLIVFSLSLLSVLLQYFYVCLQPPKTVYLS